MDADILTEQDRATLKRSVLCSAMSDEDLATLLLSGSLKTLKPSEYLFSQGDPSTDLFLILEGWAQIKREERNGAHTLIAAFHQGDSVAEAAAFLGKPYPASAQAMTDLRVLAVRGAAVIDIIQNNRQLLAQTLASVYRKLHGLVDDIEWLKSSTIRQRLAKLILEQMSGEAAQEIRLPFSKSLIAAKLGTSPQQLSRTFAELQSYGVVVKGQFAMVGDPGALRGLIDKS